MRCSSRSARRRGAVMAMPTFLVFAAAREIAAALSATVVVTNRPCRSAPAMRSSE